MTHTEQWLRDAIEGGWEPKKQLWAEDFMDCHLLDPAMWQAVGKVRGWQDEPRIKQWEIMKDWKWHQHRFIDLLAEGKSIEEALGEISK